MYLHIADLIERNGCIANSEIVGNSYNEIANNEKVSKNSYEIIVNTKYKTTDKKVKPVAMHLPMDSTEMKKNVAFEPMLRCRDDPITRHGSRGGTAGVLDRKDSTLTQALSRRDSREKK